MQKFTLKVVNVIQETPDTKTIVFKQPAFKKVKYQAGQYISLVLLINGRKYVRPYSFSSAPGVDSDIEITVKRVSGGVVSNHIIDKVAIGDVMEVMEPMGDFILNGEITHPDSHLVLWGVGSGITPLISIAKQALYNNSCAHVTLVYGNRNFETVIFNNKIEQLKEQFANNFTVWHFHTQAVFDNENMNIIQGRIKPERVLSVMNHEGNLNKTLHFICGPEGLKQSVKSVLSNLSVPDKNVFSEDFEILINPKDFEDVITRNVEIQHQSVNSTIEVVKGKSILEAGLDSLLDLSYSCQTGSCLICKARLLSGKVKTIGLDKLPDGLNEDDCLMCCSYPLDDNVKISTYN